MQSVGEGVKVSTNLTGRVQKFVQLPYRFLRRSGHSLRRVLHPEGEKRQPLAKIIMKFHGDVASLRFPRADQHATKLSLLFLSHSQLLPAEQQIDGQGGKAKYDH